MTQILSEFQQWLQIDKTTRQIQYELSMAFEEIESSFLHVRTEGLERLERFLSSIKDRYELDTLVKLQKNKKWNILDKVYGTLVDMRFHTPINDKASIDVKYHCFEVLQGIILICLNTENEDYLIKFFSDEKKFEFILSHINSIGEDKTKIVAAALETLQCILVGHNKEIVSTFMKLNGISKVSGLLKSKLLTDDVIHGCIELLYVYLDPEKPKRLSIQEEVKWIEDFKVRRKELEYCVGDSFVKQLLTTAGIGTIRLKNSTLGRQ